MTEYNFPFTRIKQVQEELERGADGPTEEERKAAQEPKIEEVKEEEEKKESDPAADLMSKLTQKPK